MWFFGKLLIIARSFSLILRILGLLPFSGSTLTTLRSLSRSAVLAAEKTLEEQPTWVYYQKALISTVSLMENLSHIIGLLKLSKDLENEFERMTEKWQSVLINFVSYKFQKEVESYLRREYH